MGIGNSDETLTTGISRRTVTKGIAWAAPAVAIAGAAPAYASSLRKDPGINGWVLNSRTGGWGCRYNLEVNSYRPGRTGDDGAPFGLYVYDIEDDNASITGGVLTYWILNSQSNVEISNGAYHSSNWQYVGSVGTEVKPDGMTYTGYQWRYTGTIDASQRPTEPDGIPRVWLGHFHVNIEFTQPRVGPWYNRRCEAVNYWTQREVQIDRDGPAGRYEFEYFTFQRRNGEDGPYVGSMRARALEVEETAEPQTGEAEPTEADFHAPDLPAEHANS